MQGEKQQEREERFGNQEKLPKKIGRRKKRRKGGPKNVEMRKENDEVKIGRWNQFNCLSCLLPTR